MVDLLIKLEHSKILSSKQSDIIAIGLDDIFDKILSSELSSNESK